MKCPSCDGEPLRGSCVCDGGDEMARAFERFVEFPEAGVAKVSRSAGSARRPVARGRVACDPVRHVASIQRPPRK